jgi:serine/threonine kinase 16
MDFGSAQKRHIQPATRREALSIQETAEAHCTASYRAPELFDVPTGQALDYAKCDIWSAGCTLYHAMYGCSPFQKAVDQPGGSIALAVMNCSIPWPKDRDKHYRPTR